MTDYPPPSPHQAPADSPHQTPPQQWAAGQDVTPVCSRQTYILVGVLTGIFLAGGFGIHNFIAGRTQTAVVQLVLCIVGVTMIFCTLGFSSLINIGVLVWTIVEVCTVFVDGRGRKMI